MSSLPPELPKPPGATPEGQASVTPASTPTEGGVLQPGFSATPAPEATSPTIKPDMIIPPGDPLTGIKPMESPLNAPVSEPGSLANVVAQIPGTPPDGASMTSLNVDPAAVAASKVQSNQAFIDANTQAVAGDQKQGFVTAATEAWTNAVKGLAADSGGAQDGVNVVATPGEVDAIGKTWRLTDYRDQTATTDRGGSGKFEFGMLSRPENMGLDLDPAQFETELVEWSDGVSAKVGETKTALDQLRTLAQRPEGRELLLWMVGDIVRKHMGGKVDQTGTGAEAVSPTDKPSAENPFQAKPDTSGNDTGSGNMGQ